METKTIDTCTSKAKAWCTFKAKAWGTLLAQTVFLSMLESSVLFAFVEKKGQGAVVEFDAGRGKVTVPHGWSYSLDFPQTTFMAREAEERAKDYRRTMQILKQKGSISIDSFGAKKYSEKIGKVIRDDAVRLEDFEVYEGDVTTLADGSQAIVLYSSFKVQDKVMMNLHVVVSTDEYHYLLTYTDLKSRFGENGATSPEFDEAWGIANTLSILDARGGSVDIWTKWVVAIAVMMAGILTIQFFRKRETEIFSEQVTRSSDGDERGPRVHAQAPPRSEFSVSHEDFLIQSQAKRRVSAIKNVFSKKSLNKPIDDDVEDDVDLDAFR